MNFDRTSNRFINGRVHLIVQSLENKINSRWIIPALLILAAAIRILWCQIREAGVTGEAFQVASTLAKTGRFADAFGSGSGPTAHLPPIGPGIAALVYSIFGIDTISSNFVLASYAIIIVVASYALGRKIFEELGSPRLAQIIALFALATFPIYLGVETAENRVWETGLCVVLYLTFILMIIKFERETKVSISRLVTLMVLASVIFFINPIIGITTYIIFGIFTLRHFNAKKVFFIVLSSLIILIATLTPWAVRNQMVMKSFIPLRSNMGLELALANFPEAVNTQDPGAEFFKRFSNIHPGMVEGRKQFDQAGGEVAYSNKLKKQTIAWIVANPTSYLRLYASHLGQFIMPRPWLFTFGLGTNLEVIIRATLASAIGLLGIAGVIISIFNRNWRYKYTGLAVILPAMGYASFQPSLRYVYLIYCLQAFFAAEILVIIFCRIKIIFDKKYAKNLSYDN